MTRTKVLLKWKHLAGHRRNPYFYKAIKKYGWENISHEISQETREKIRRKLKENPARHWQGKKFSEETKRKMREARSKQKPPRAIAVVCIDTGVIYSNAVEASKATGCNSSSIRRVCKGEYEHTHNLRFAYLEREE